MEDPPNIYNNLKSDPQFICKNHGTIDISIIEESIGTMIFKERPKVANTILKNVTNYMFFSRINDVNKWIPYDPIDTDKYVIYDALFDTFNQLLTHKFAEIYPDKIIMRAFLANLPAKDFIEPHIDRGDYFYYINRVLIPIITNEKVLFRIDDTIFHMKCGEIYEINNLKMHECVNKSGQNRVHLICDLLDKYYVS